MACSTNLIGISWILLQILCFCYQTRAEFPDFGVIQDIAVDIQKKLSDYLDGATGFTTIQKRYQDESVNMDLQPVDPDGVVNKMSEEVSRLLEKKVSALRKSVEWAEAKAQEYKWQNNLEIDDVPYEDAKLLNLSNPAFQYSNQYKRVVSFDNSSVHIPVEIYKGTMSILNELVWTNSMDEQWRNNKEADPDLLWQYFGSQSGLMRNYPASEWPSDPEIPDLYDVRRRPWYTQGISSPKDMLILVDTSGSTQGIALTLMKQAIDSLLDTLSPNDFINVVHFSADAKPVVPCFETFVQANHWNKEILKYFINGLKADGMASYTKAFEYAFQQFEKLEEIQRNGSDNVGANCNKVIMFLTDGGSETPEEVFNKYNSDKSIRIFSYAVGPTANPIEAVRWIACENKGYFYKIPSMGAIRSIVQRYYKFLAYGLAESQTQDVLWTHPYADQLGLGMLTTVTMPVYNRTLDASNQTILGVMGTDMTVNEMRAFTQTRRLGPNGYVMAINTNGYMLLHPDLTAEYGWVTDPVNTDLLDIEYSTPEKEELRQNMIDGKTGKLSITSLIYYPGQKYIDNQTRIYHYSNITNSSFSMAVVVPSYANLYFDRRIKPIPLEQGINSLKSEQSTILLAPWDYCPSLSLPTNESLVDELIQRLMENANDCDETLLQHLFTDVNITAAMTGKWSKELEEDNGVYSFIISTNAGMTYVFPANTSSLMHNYQDPWEAVYYKRSFDNDHWIYSAPYSATDISMNSSMPLVLASRAIRILVKGTTYVPGVVGAWVEQDKLRQIMFTREPQCADTSIYSCYFLDDGGFLILSNSDDDSHKVGRFFGDNEVEPVLMNKLINISVYIQNTLYDYQAACQVIEEDDSAAPSIRSLFTPLLFDVMSVSWWTSKLSWSWLNFGVMQWMLSAYNNYGAYSMPVYSEEVEEFKNRSCVKQLEQFTFSSGDKTEFKNDLVYENCTRKYATSRMKQSNLLFVMAERDCCVYCQPSHISQTAVEVEDPNLVAARSGKCETNLRYRKRSLCYDYNSDEDGECSGSAHLTPIVSLLSLISVSYITL